MAVNNAFYGLIKSGPMKGQQLGHTERRYVPKDNSEGFYVFVAQRGPIPSEWKWIERPKK